MRKGSMLAIIAFILLFVLSIMTSKTEVVQLDHGSGVNVQILHDSKLFFIHSFQLELLNGSGGVITMQEPLTFTVDPGDIENTAFMPETVVPEQSITSEKETIWRLSRRFHFSTTIHFELDGQQQTINISERLGD